MKMISLFVIFLIGTTCRSLLKTDRITQSPIGSANSTDECLTLLPCRGDDPDDQCTKNFSDLSKEIFLKFKKNLHYDDPVAVGKEMIPVIINEFQNKNQTIDFRTLYDEATKKYDMTQTPKITYAQKIFCDRAVYANLKKDLVDKVLAAMKNLNQENINKLLENFGKEMKTARETDCDSKKFTNMAARVNLFMRYLLDESMKVFTDEEKQKFYDKFLTEFKTLIKKNKGSITNKCTLKNKFGVKSCYTN